MGVREYRPPVKSAGSSNPTLTNDSHPELDEGVAVLLLPRFVQAGMWVLMREIEGEAAQKDTARRQLGSSEI